MTIPSAQPLRNPCPPTARSITLIGLSVLLALFVFAQLSFTGIIALVNTHPTRPLPPAPAPGADVGLLVVLTIWSALIIPAALLFQFLFLRFIRRRTNGWIMLLVAYAGVKIFNWAVANGMGFFALICCIIFRSFIPFWYFSALSILFMLANLPLGRPLRPFSPAPTKPL